MIGKVGIGSSFSGVLRYVLQRPEASILYAEGVREISIQSAADDFNMQRKMNPELGKPVGHIVLSWSANDKAKLSPEKMVACAKEYLHKMKISDTQYLITEHRDKSHPHVHIIYNRVNNQGKTISDRFQKKQNCKVCKDITQKYGYHLGKGKSLVNRQQLTGADKIKYELYDAITPASRTAQSWAELEATLKKQGIWTIFKYKSGTNQVQGVSFIKDGITLKGSKIDRSLSFARIRKRSTKTGSNSFKLIHTTGQCMSQ
ncbi:Relaxase/Mobilisation nuclease domain-containing protein [Dyadobacter sp. SG02]|uniref:relaxase/mobilization nuclease domain-containing protein n=1 Tax=Dyadobacter sp. SG02 TaxID=1855291 RepID=UPI0008AFB890|nr:relaxase/mobilization nuclease domain-containing protein [Dyadobacter sp. SG02]SEI83692.1 Relaxase/Mobilisation nuclease domain-containing protein [Dyadobacter sp. SG02]